MQIRMMALAEAVASMMHPDDRMGEALLSVDVAYGDDGTMLRMDIDVDYMEPDGTLMSRGYIEMLKDNQVVVIR